MNYGKVNGKKAENHWAYVEIAGEKRYLVALSQFFGISGAYVDIYLENGEIIPCLVSESKRLHEETPDNTIDSKGGCGSYWYDQVQYGHTVYGKNRGMACSVVEVQSQGVKSTSEDWDTMSATGILDSLYPVEAIQYGGTWLEHKDGPVGLDGSYGKSKKENSTFQGFLGGALRNLWIGMETALENQIHGRQDSTNFYVAENDSHPMGNGDIVAACEEVTRMLLDRGCKYPPGCDWNYLDWKRDIENQLFNDEYFCCATYVASVLYYSGALSEEEINAYNYHWTGAGGIPSMLEAAGWTNVAGKDEAKAGDVINKNGVHVLIYAGDGLCWDQSSAVYSSSGSPPSGSKRSYNLSGCEIWRKPN